MSRYKGIQRNGDEDMDNGFQNNMNMDKLTKDEMIMMLMDLLKQNNMQEKSNVMYETAAYIDVLESKLDQMSKELTAMRKQLVEMDNKTLAAGIKEAINKSITKSQIAINDMKEKVSEVKSEMKAKAKSIVEEIKLKGKAALNRVAEFTRLTSKLAYVREGIREGIKETDKTIERINGFGHGMRNAGRQIVNSFRVLAGHEEKESSEEKKMYITGILRSPWVGQKKVYEGMERVLNGAIDRLENLSKEMTEEKSKDNKSSYDEFENEKTESMEMVGPEWEMEVAEEEKFYGDEFFQPEEEIEFIDLDDVPEKKMVAEGKSR